MIDEIGESFKQIPEIQQCYCLTGEFDFFLVIVVPSMSYNEKFTCRIFFSNKNIKKFHTIVVMEINKNTLEIPMPLLFLTTDQR
ncbi:Lrp/AsnC ligand binding domain-containing protein [Chryseobacterium sp. Leaf404]|uniref:Lrp/AsnC ligand binding domain-containing protein n=1 Tax=unclassified Chryseobacterium TaxID=2593645 RepID=UPI0012FF2241|nr:Lrp/AsnC ligand binding domain-containing protein [Chryseobacterium sp. Leaf404]